ncbi:MAG: hypothetical protein NTV00_11095 [Methylococcales bacterium]|nr:hypothetical protein [Methylococcales bacterium]
MRKLKWLGLISLLGLYANTAQAVAYLYQDVTTDTLPTRYCYPVKKATALTADRYNLDRFSKLFCNTLGEGWHVDKRKEDGSAVCTPCTGDDQGLHQCFMQNVVVTCKQIKPDSLGKVTGKK